MDRVTINQLPDRLGQRVRLEGWLQHRRKLGGLNFVLLRDRTGLAQIRVASPLPGVLNECPAETVLSVIGQVVADRRAPGGVEIHDPRFEVLSRSLPPRFNLAAPTLAASLPIVLDEAALSLRHPTRRVALELQAALVRGFRGTLDAQGFTEVFTPKIAGATAEGGSQVFAVTYFEEPAYLVQSPQLYKQMLVGVLERVFEVGPVFRAEPHDTARHLAQYTSLDVEMGFIDDHRDLIALLREVMAGMAAAGLRLTAAPVQAGAPEVPPELPVLHFVDAIRLLVEAGVQPSGPDEDLTPAGERWLGEWALRHHDSDFLVVEGYPLRSRPFYTHPDPDRPGYSRGFDLLFRGMEIVTGGQRRHALQDYLAIMTERGMDPGPFAAYLDAFRYGMPPHGGFAIGLERVVKQWLAAGNVREVTAFPRYRGRLAP